VAVSGLRRWSASERREIVAEYEEAPHGSKQLVLRRREVTPKQVRQWRGSRDAGLLESGGVVRNPKAIPKSESAELIRLRAENRRLEVELERARKDIDDRQRSLDTMGKATALLQQLVSGKRAADE
jgi:transposase